MSLILNDLRFLFQISTFTLTAETPARLTADGAVLVLQAPDCQENRFSLRDTALVFLPPTDRWSSAYSFAVPDLPSEHRGTETPILFGHLDVISQSVVRAYSHLASQ